MKKNLLYRAKHFIVEVLKIKKGYPYVPIFKSDTGRIVDFIRGRV